MEFETSALSLPAFHWKGLIHALILLKFSLRRVNPLKGLGHGWALPIGTQDVTSERVRESFDSDRSTYRESFDVDRNFAYRESLDSDQDFGACIANNLIQNGTLERGFANYIATWMIHDPCSEVPMIWFTNHYSDQDYRARFSIHLIQIGISEHGLWIFDLDRTSKRVHEYLNSDQDFRAPIANLFSDLFFKLWKTKTVIKTKR